MTALLPCPFCGKDAILIDEDGYKTDKSDWCSCNGINCMGLLEQVKVVNWQKRPTESALRAENAKLREALENLEKVAKNSIEYGDGKLIARILIPTIQEVLK